MSRISFPPLSFLSMHLRGLFVDGVVHGWCTYSAPPIAEAAERATAACSVTVARTGIVTTVQQSYLTP